MTESITPKVGDIVYPDTWHNAHGGPLVVCDDWDKAEYRIVTWHRAEGGWSPTKSGFVELAVNVEVTGRKIRQIPGYRGFGYRCKVTFVGDGEPDQVVGGWMHVS